MLIISSSVIFTGGVRLENSSSSYGAAVAVVQGHLSFENASLQNNQGIYGAGIYSHNANLTFSEGTTLCNNVAILGGAIYATNSNLNFEGRNSFLQNVAMNDGGLLLTNNSNRNLFPRTNVYFISNHAAETGGAIKVQEGTLLSYCTNVIMH